MTFGPGGGKSDNQQQAPADEYGAYKHGDVEGRYVDAHLWGNGQAVWHTYRAAPSKPIPIGETRQLGFWIHDNEPLAIDSAFYISVTMEGCAPENYDAYVTHFEQHELLWADVSFYQDGPVWESLGIASGFIGHNHVTGPWKISFTRKPGVAAADCEFHDIELSFRSPEPPPIEQ